jgi:hypothetical protein
MRIDIPKYCTFSLMISREIVKKNAGGSGIIREIFTFIY